MGWNTLLRDWADATDKRLETLIEREIGRLGADGATCGPCESISVEVDTGIARIYDDWAEGLHDATELLNALKGRPADGFGPEIVWDVSNDLRDVPGREGR